MPSRSRLPLATAALLIASALAILRYLFLAATYAVDVPYADDYDAILAFTIDSFTEESAAAFVARFVSFHNEHRMALPRLVYLSEALVLGRLDFRVLALCGNLFLVLVFVVILRATPETSPWKKLPVAAVIFQVSGWENVAWATVAVQGFLVLACAFAALFLLSREGRAPLVLALLAVVCAALTQANGLLTIPAGALLLALRARWRDLAVWTAAGLVIFVLFAHGFERPTGHPSPIDALRSPLATARFFLLLLGSPFGSEAPALAFGAAFAVVTVLVIVRYARAARENDLLIALLAFVLGSCVLVTLGRCGFGEEYALSARYRVNVVLAYVLVWLIARPLEGRSLAVRAAALFAACALALAANVAAERAYRPFLHTVRVSQLAGIEGWPEGDFRPGYPSAERARELLLRAEELGIYALPRVGADRVPFAR